MQLGHEIAQEWIAAWAAWSCKWSIVKISDTVLVCYAGFVRSQIGEECTHTWKLAAPGFVRDRIAQSVPNAAVYTTPSPRKKTFVLT